MVLLVPLDQTKEASDWRVVSALNVNFLNENLPANALTNAPSVGKSCRHARQPFAVNIRSYDGKIPDVERSAKILHDHLATSL
jgi:hypothetical protein